MLAKTVLPLPLTSFSRCFCIAESISVISCCRWGCRSVKVCKKTEMPTCMSPFTGLKVAKNATTSPSNISPLTEANIKLQFLLLSASWPPWNLITVMYCPECSPRPGRKRQPIPLPAKLGQDSWSHFKPFESVLQENFVTALHYCRNEWVHKVWTGIVGRSRSHHISLSLPPFDKLPCPPQPGTIYCYGSKEERGRVFVNMDSFSATQLVANVS